MKAGGQHKALYHDKREVLNLQRRGYSQHEAYRMAFLANIPLNIKRCVFEDILSAFTPVFAPWPTGASAITLDPLPRGISLQWPLSLFYLAGLCAFPVRGAFQIHFQVNTGWPATNLRPTGVVTAVADNGKSKLQPGSGMFTVTTGKLAANIFFFFFPLRLFLRRRLSRY